MLHYTSIFLDFIMLIHGLSQCGHNWYLPSELEHEEEEQDFAVAVDENGDLFDSYLIELVPYRNDELGDPVKIPVKKLNNHLLQFDFQNFRIKMFTTGESMNYSGDSLHPDFEFLLKKIEFKPNIIPDLIFEETSYIIIGCNPDGY